MKLAIAVMVVLAAGCGSKKTPGRAAAHDARSASRGSATDDPYSAATWIARLDDPRESERAVTELEQLGDPAAIPALGKAWSAMGKPVRVLQVIIALARPLTAEEAKAAFLTAYEKSGRPASWQAALPVLTEAASKSDPDNPRSIDSAIKALEALGEQGSPEAQAAVLAVATDPLLHHSKAVPVRIAATRALGSFHDPAVVAALTAQLSSSLDRVDTAPSPDLARDDLVIAGATVNALAGVRSPAAIPALIDALYRAPALANQVRRALVASGPGVAPELAKALRGEHPAVNARFLDHKLGFHCAAGAKKCQPLSAMAFYAALVLGDLHDASVIPELVAALASKPLPAYYADDAPATVTQHHAIFDALRKLGGTAGADRARAMWSDRKQPLPLRVLAVAAYGWLAPDASAVPALRTLINTPATDDQLRQEALLAVARIARADADLEVFRVLAKVNLEMVAKSAKQPGVQSQYLDHVRTVQLHLARAEIALHCGKDAACYGATLATATGTDAERAAAGDAIGTRMGPLLADWTDWTADDKRALVGAQIERAMIELGRLGSAAASQTDALLAAAASTDPIVRQSVLAALPLIAALPCPTCEQALTRAIAADTGTSDLAALTLETEVVRNYFTWAGM